MKETIENRAEIIDFSFSVVETGIKMMYHCNFETSLSIEDLMKLLQFFDKYNIPSLKDKVESHLIAQISASNVCHLTNASILSNYFKLAIAIYSNIDQIKRELFNKSRVRYCNIIV
uniref:BTB domain-containing protein n=1 Tax=Panagrolaimus davidi TaxID=227884 RepID=A0A914Q937_9BILA